MSTEPVGSLAEEAAKLIAALQGWATDHRGESSPDEHTDADPDIDRDDSAQDSARLASEHEAGGHDPLSVECRYCPLCRLARLAKAASPEVREHLASAALSLALAFKGFVEQSAAATGESTPVEKIDLAED